MSRPDDLSPPTFATPITTDEMADAMAVLDSDDLTGDDLLWAMGEPS
jgi:hypothetical protein